MIGDKGELPIAMALSNVVTSQQMDELARVFVTLFDAKHLLSPLLWNMFYREVDVSECMQVSHSHRRVHISLKIQFHENVWMIISQVRFVR